MLILSIATVIQTGIAINASYKKITQIHQNIHQIKYNQMLFHMSHNLLKSAKNKMGDIVISKDIDL
jgi:hypothetical protein